MNKAVIQKAVLLVLASITASVGLYSHYKSDWTGIDHSIYNGTFFQGDTAPYHICDNWPSRDKCGKVPFSLCFVSNIAGCDMTYDTCSKCPNIALERCFIGVSIICVIGALASFGLSFVGKDNRTLKYADAGLNFIFGVLLVIASILYIVSAAQIHKLLEPLQYLLAWLRSINSEINERYGAKIVAGVIGILQSLVHCAVAVMSLRR